MAIATPKKRPVPVFTFPPAAPDTQVVTNPRPVPVPPTVAAAPKPTTPPAATTPKPAPPTPSRPQPSKPAAPKPASTQNPSGADKPTTATFTTTTETAPETLLEIYFTDGKGKFYTSTPPMQLIDPKTNKEVKKFYRTTDAKGNPDPQTVPAGNYTLVIGKTGNYLAKNVTIQANNHNKVYIQMFHRIFNTTYFKIT